MSRRTSLPVRTPDEDLEADLDRLEAEHGAQRSQTPRLQPYRSPGGWLIHRFFLPKVPLHDGVRREYVAQMSALRPLLTFWSGQLLFWVAIVLFCVVLPLLLSGCGIFEIVDNPDTGYRNDPRFSLGLPMEYTTSTGATVFVPAMPNKTRDAFRGRR